MEFCKMHPFVRFSRYLSKEAQSAILKPYDCRLFYVERGTAGILANGQEYALLPTDTLIIAPGIPYCVHTVSPDTKILALNFDFTFQHRKKALPIPPALLEDFEENHLLEHISFSDFPEFNTVAAIPGMGAFFNELTKIHNEFSQKLRHHEAVESACLIRFLTACARSLKEPTDHSATPVTDEMITYLNEHFCENLTNAELGKMFHYHPNYIGSLVRAKTGMPLRRYLLNLRIMRAITLLETTQNSVTQIAQEVGFCDISYFSNYFKQITGRTPKEFRNK